MRLEKNLAEWLCREHIEPTTEENEAMFHRHLISSLLAGVALLAASSLAQAACCPPACAPAPCVVAQPITRTITVMEMVPETYETTRTVYKPVCVTENYTYFKKELVPEVRTCTKQITKLVPEIREEVCTTYKCVPTTETRTIIKKVVVCKPVTCIERKCIDQGHWECCLVPARKSLCARLREPLQPLRLRGVPQVQDQEGLGSEQGVD